MASLSTTIIEVPLLAEARHGVFSIDRGTPSRGDMPLLVGGSGGISAFRFKANAEGFVTSKPLAAKASTMEILVLISTARCCDPAECWLHGEAPAGEGGAVEIW